MSHSQTRSALPTRLHNQKRLMFEQENQILCVNALRDVLPLAEARAEALTKESEARPKAVKLRRKADEAIVATLNARALINTVASSGLEQARTPEVLDPA